MVGAVGPLVRDAGATRRDGVELFNGPGVESVPLNPDRCPDPPERLLLPGVDERHNCMPRDLVVSTLWS
jgi:hypothetical protein